jgi:hypothetical protein
VNLCYAYVKRGEKSKRGMVVADGVKDGWSGVTHGTGQRAKEVFSVIESCSYLCV